MNILVTGGCGFIGSNFINYMCQKYPNYKLINIDALYYSASLDNISKHTQCSNNYKFIKGNINDTVLLRYVLKQENITHIVHFAAQSHVDNSFDNSLQYTQDNVMGTHSLLELVKKINPNIVFLHFSTDEVYGESDLNETPKHEMSLLCPTNPYAATKAAAEMLVNSYRHSFKLNTIILRCNNVWGPNQYPEKLLPKFIKLLKENKKCTIQGDGSSLRSFIYVYDVCTATDIVLHNGIYGEIYNIGSDFSQEKNVKEIAEMLIKLLKPNEPYYNWIEYVIDRPFNDKRYFITNEKIKKLGWEQTIFIENELPNYVEHLKK